MSTNQKPDLNLGIEYWNTQPASVDGVLGGYGTGALPRVETLGSRRFVLDLLPELCTVPSALRPLKPTQSKRRTRAVDVGAGIGRVTSSVLLHLVQDVVLVEPVDHFVRKALVQATAPVHASGEWKGIDDRTKSVTIVKGALQAFDPREPLEKLTGCEILGRAGYSPEAGNPDPSGYDVIWCQWCMGHLSDEDLVRFLKQSKEALRSTADDTGDFDGIIVIKENLCSEETPGEARTVFDDEDNSLTRSDHAWKKCIEAAGLRIVKEEIQLGLPVALYAVKTYALR
ncbi:DUF858-domain-containing protein [Schizopora paradoxa]|uniref:Alpha N-terminal protein methyltransferase 1 n=1 Tax=Schizopora paradoxa TaxID=27342 RepID=A0A0H2RYV2_9AGAM|nr:DUF858-domain-containing protein [Schizopora paradoxa]